MCVSAVIVFKLFMISHLGIPHLLNSKLLVIFMFLSWFLSVSVHFIRLCGGLIKRNDYEIISSSTETVIYYFLNVNLYFAVECVNSKWPPRLYDFKSCAPPHVNIPHSPGNFSPPPGQNSLNETISGRYTEKPGQAAVRTVRSLLAETLGFGSPDRPRAA